MLEILQVHERIADAPKGVNALENELVLELVLPQTINDGC
jgi:hypothetical protein